MAGGDDIVVKAPGLSKLRRDLKKIDKDLGRDATRHVREIAKSVRDEARSNLQERSKNPTGAMARTIKHSVKSRGASIYSDHEGSGVQEWGGRISPRGTPIEISGKAYMRDAVVTKADDVAEQLGDLLDVIARRNGF